MKEKIIEILKQVATQAITSELNPDELDPEGFDEFATRIASLYSEITEKEIVKIIDEVHIQLNKHFIGDRSVNIGKVKKLATKAILSKFKEE